MDTSSKKGETPGPGGEPANEIDGDEPVEAEVGGEGVARVVATREDVQSRAEELGSLIEGDEDELIEPADADAKTGKEPPSILGAPESEAA